jgi:pSer/pThr/pTyr-binding forkhead associated (FHA) protein
MPDPAPASFVLFPLGVVPDIPVGPAGLILGRSPSCGVRLDSPRVSRHHCYLTEVAGVVLVRDLGSTNGTRINGRGVTLGWLAPGDELAVADLRFRLLRRPGAGALQPVDPPAGLALL